MITEEVPVGHFDASSRLTYLSGPSPRAVQISALNIDLWVTTKILSP